MIECVLDIAPMASPIRSKEEYPSDRLPEKARLLHALREHRFRVPDFIYVPAEDFKNGHFESLEAFLKNHRNSYKVLARSAHPLEEFYKGGTFDSLDTYADVGGIVYARKKMIKSCKTTKRLALLRQQKFSGGPDIDPEDMGVIVMPFVDGLSVMAKMMGDRWEFGYSRDRIHKVQSEPFITSTPHDRRLLDISEDIQNKLGFRCEIEYIVSELGDIYVVQAKDISHIETLEKKESLRSVRLDGVRRIRKRRNYRERPVFVMDTRAFYLDIIDKCEDMVLKAPGGATGGIEDILELIYGYEAELEDFSLRHERFAIIGLSIRVPEELYQIANHYLDDTPELQRQLSSALNCDIYFRDYFLSEADTLIAKDAIRVNLGTHDAYGIDTVRNPLWSVYWNVERHDQVVGGFRSLGFRTGDTLGIEIDAEEKPTVYRL